MKKTKIEGDKSCLPELESRRKGPISQDAQEKEENAPLALQNPNAVQVSKAWRNFGFLGGNRLRQRKERGREGEAKKHFLQKLISCRDHLASARLLQGSLARPHLHSRLCPEPKLCSEKAPEGERGRRCDSYCPDSNARIPCIAIEIGRHQMRLIRKYSEKIISQDTLMSRQKKENHDSQILMPGFC